MTAGEIAQLLTALAVVGNMVLSWRTHSTAVKTQESMKEAKEDIRTIEKATNSLTDRLVATTATASHAEGEKAGRLELQREQIIQSKEKSNGNR